MQKQDVVMWGLFFSEWSFESADAVFMEVIHQEAISQNLI